MQRHTPEDINSLVRQTVAAATALAADRDAMAGVRRDCAVLVHSLSGDVGRDETVCAEVMGAALRSVDDWRVVSSLLGAAVATAPDEGRLAVPVLRLCERAFEQGQAETLTVGLNWLARVARDERDGDVPAEWFGSVATVSPRRLPCLLRGWVERFGAQHVGLRALVRQHERCLLARFVSLEVVRAIHEAQPTVSGWLALARDEGAADAPGLSFGDQQEEALATLREARERAEEDAVRERLSAWLSRLSAT